MIRLKLSKFREFETDGCLMAGFLGLFTSLAAVAVVFVTVRPLADMLAARTWVATQCAIVSSQLVEEPVSADSAYRVEIIYTYERGGQTYRGSRLNFDAGSTIDPEVMAGIVEAHPPGSEHDCYVDPKDPTRSVIDRSPGSFLWWGVLPLAFLAIGVGGSIFFLIVRGVIPYS